LKHHALGKEILMGKGEEMMEMIPPSVMAWVESHEVDSFMMAPVTYLYAGCDYQTPTGATEEENHKWLQMHDRACHSTAAAVGGEVGREQAGGRASGEQPGG
jgi:hypothetical protein